MSALSFGCVRDLGRSAVARSLVGLSVLLLGLAAAAPAQSAPEDIMVGAFDKITGVPIMSAMLGLVRAGERVPTTPAVLDERLRAVEALLREVDSRLKIVESRLRDVEDEVIRLANIGRMRELQRIRAEIAAIAQELLGHPTDPTRLAILTFRAGQQADIIRDNVDFDIWKWSDRDPATGRLRSGFRVLPSFELYTLALQTWMAAALTQSAGQPQVIVRDQGPSLLAHADFLRTRDGWRERRTDVDATPTTLPEHLKTAVYCRLEPAERYADRQGYCTFGVGCLDEIEGTRVDSGELMELAVGAPGATTLCSWNPDQVLFLEGEEELRNEHGLELMTALAQSLERLGRTGSLAEQQVWPFPDTTSGTIFSVALDRPLAAPRNTDAGVEPLIIRCPSFGGCRLTNESREAQWTFGGAAGFVRNIGSGHCLDVRDNAAVADAPLVLWPCNQTASQLWDKQPVTNQHYRLASRGNGLCATVKPLPQAQLGRIAFDAARPLLLQPCDGRQTQVFSNTDSNFRGPN